MYLWSHSLLLDMYILIFMSKVSSITIGTTCLYFHPHFQALYMKYMIALSWKSFYSFILFKVFQTDVASAISKISISFQKNNGCNFSEILIMIAHNLLELLIVLVLNSVQIFINSSILNSSLHKKYAKFIQSKNKLLPLCDFFLYITNTLIQKIYSILFLYVYLTDQFNNIFLDVWTFLLSLKPSHQYNHKNQNYDIIQKAPSYEESIWFSIWYTNWMFKRIILLCLNQICWLIFLKFRLIKLYWGLLLKKLKI